MPGWVYPLGGRAEAASTRRRGVSSFGSGWGAEYPLVPIFLRVTKPFAVDGCLEFAELPHVHTVTLAYCYEFSEFVFSGSAFEIDNESSPSLTLISLHARYAGKPLEVRTLIV
jgi:hypothetical protein